MKSLSIAATGMLAQQLNVEVISNNIANMNTTAFKRQRAEFQDLLYQNLERMGSATSDSGTVLPTGIQIGAGVKAGSVYRIEDQGNIITTNNKYDVAVQGKGWFRVTLPSGSDAFTRAGSFALSPQGQIVTADGYIVQPGITIPANAIDVAISKSGQVQATIAGQTAPSVVGQLELSNFSNEAGLEAIGDNLYTETAASGQPSSGSPGAIGFGTLLQGSLETSNVNAVSEITALITAQRAYEMNAKVITASDEMLQTTSQMR
jgi:flagellar basal-body rod protein FlgG